MEQWLLLLLYGGVCACGVGARSGGIMILNGFTGTDLIQNVRMSWATFKYNASPQDSRSRTLSSGDPYYLSKHVGVGLYGNRGG